VRFGILGDQSFDLTLLRCRDKDDADYAAVAAALNASSYNMPVATNATVRKLPTLEREQIPDAA